MRRELGVLATAALMGAALAAPAMAQDQEGQGETPPAESTEGVGSEAERERVEDLFEREPVMYQITFPRFQTIVTPAFMLDAFFEMHPNHWSDGQTNYAFGGEFIIRRIEQFDLVFSVDWADIRTKDDWWLENDEQLIDTDWGENDLSILTFDVAINWITVLEEYWHLYYGVGLGLGIVLGDFLKYDINGECVVAQGVNPFESEDTRLPNNEPCRVDGEPNLEDPDAPKEEDRVPPVLPALTLTFGNRWIIDDQWAVQIEVGFKNIYLYAGLELGYVWE